MSFAIREQEIQETLSSDWDQYKSPLTDKRIYWDSVQYEMSNL